MKVTQRVVSAAQGGPVPTGVARSVFDLGRVSGSDASGEDPGDAPAPPPAPSPAVVNAFGTAPRPISKNADTQENTVSPAPSKRGRKPASDALPTPRFQILSALMAHGDLDVPALKSKTTSLDMKQIGNALYQARANEQADRKASGAWHITKKGRDWVTGGANLGNQQRAGTSPAQVKTSRRTPKRPGKELDAHEQQRTGVVHIAGRDTPLQLVERHPTPRTFRCAIFSDGAFQLTKGEASIELDAAEHKQLLHYLERMAEPDAAVA